MNKIGFFDSLNFVKSENLTQKKIGIRKLTTAHSLSDFPDELIVNIFDQIAFKPLKNPNNLDSLTSLFCCARVSKKWFNIAESYFAKIFKLVLDSQQPLDGKSWSQMVRIVKNWQQQTKKISYSSFSKVSRESFQAHQYRLPIEFPTIIFDKIEINHFRVSLLSKHLIGERVETFIDGTRKLTTQWFQPVDKPEKTLFISIDQKLFATQHYQTRVNKLGFKWLICRFDVRLLDSGRLLGQVQIVSPKRKGKVFDQLHVKFDWTTFVYQRNERIFMRTYEF